MCRNSGYPMVGKAEARGSAEYLAGRPGSNSRSEEQNMQRCPRGECRNPALPGEICEAHKQTEEQNMQVDWHVAYVGAMEKFIAETRTTSFLVGLLREAQTPCQRCGNATGSGVLVVGDERTFVCGICVARTPDFEARLAERMREDKPLLDRLADDRPIRVKDTSKWPPREKP